MRYLFALLLPALFTAYAATSYTPTEDYAVRFSTKKAEGTFRGLTGTIRFDADDLNGSLFDVSVDVATIATGNKTQDKHARGSGWFDAEEYPRITFRSSSFTRAGDGFAVRGTLTMRGHAEEVTIPFTFADRVFSGGLTVNRETYGIDGPFLFGGLVGEEVLVELRIPVE